MKDSAKLGYDFSDFAEKIDKIFLIFVFQKEHLFTSNGAKSIISIQLILGVFFENMNILKKYEKMVEK